MPNINKGDVVVMIDHPHLMYVYTLCNKAFGQDGDIPGALCVWFENNRLYESVFDLNALQRASQPRVAKTALAAASA